jgi:hypothetical protein
MQRPMSTEFREGNGLPSYVFCFYFCQLTFSRKPHVFYVCIQICEGFKLDAINEFCVPRLPSNVQSSRRLEGQCRLQRTKNFKNCPHTCPRTARSGQGWAYESVDEQSLQANSRRGAVSAPNWGAPISAMEWIQMLPCATSGSSYICYTCMQWKYKVAVKIFTGTRPVVRNAGERNVKQHAVIARASQVERCFSNALQHWATALQHPIAVAGVILLQTLVPLF